MHCNKTLLCVAMSLPVVIELFMESVNLADVSTESANDMSCELVVRVSKYDHPFSSKTFHQQLPKSQSIRLHQNFHSPDIVLFKLFR